MTFNFIEAHFSTTLCLPSQLCVVSKKEVKMPKIELSNIPGLETAQALFGSASNHAATYDDTIVEIMVFIWETTPPPPPGVI